MRTLSVIPAILCLATSPAAADAPFAPRAPQSDYIVTMVEKSFSREDGSRTVTHHGDWTRVDLTKGSYRVTEYFSANGVANIRVYDGRSISLVRGPERSPNTEYEPRDTGERQSYLGEPCTLWDVWRTKDERIQGRLSYLSCVADDGIELWHGYRRGDEVTTSVEATRIERRPVGADEVRPPRTLLTLNWWEQITPALTAPDISDHETVMEPSGNPATAGKSIRTTRRIGPWQFMEQIVGSRRHLEIAHDSNQMRFDYISDESGAPKQLVIQRQYRSLSSSETLVVTRPTSFQPVDLNRTDTVLGETCRWFNMLPGMADAGRSACLTKDGIVLKDNSYGRASRQEWVAVRFARRPVAIDEIKPPAELLDPQLWGIE